ncbi:MAG: DNA-binding protein [Bacteroidetes bacterium GWF2_43_63]|nr:MAG: DNA-binding protein [Bacteroidetes bacterium GWE2_42_42]OFY54825.1 MAG: DNA-binding protein [Bacteroidetes bacterium GWF2_43_63]HCB63275.1 DNA-binding protein [Bacteroidales bacterium]HCY22017.1 DNA-binding protein [Bacteroidales bacterium]
MNKAELVDAIAAEAKLTKVDSKKAIEAFLKVVKGSLKKKNNVVLVGFGTFKVKKMAARNGKNPRTGKTIKIAAKNVVRFKAGTDLAKKVK